MRIFRLWPRVQILLAAHLLGAGIIGLVQFATTRPVHPGSCFVASGPGERFWGWICAGLKGPLSDRFTDSDLERLGAMLAGFLISAIWLGLSVWAMRPVRLKLDLHLRSLMMLIALVPIEWTVGGEVWKWWERWGNYRILATYYESMETLLPEMAREQLPELNAQEAQELRRIVDEMLAENRRLKERYQRAVWHPWSDAETDAND